MTTTVPRITLDTDCPSWCVRHAWYGGGEGQESHHHGAEVELSYPPFQEETRERQFTVEPIREVNEDGTVENHVFMNDRADGVLTSAAEVAKLIAALHEAARLAFGEQTP